MFSDPTSDVALALVLNSGTKDVAPVCPPAFAKHFAHAIGHERSCRRTGLPAEGSSVVVHQVFQPVFFNDRDRLPSL